MAYKHKFTRKLLPQRPVQVASLVLFVAFFAITGITALHSSFGLTPGSQNGQDNQSGGSSSESATERIVVQYKPGADVATLKQNYVKQHAVQTDENTALRFDVLKVPKSRKVQVIQDLSNDSRVQSVEPDYIVKAEASVPNDPQYAQQTYWGQTGINKVWDTTKGKEGFVVAIIDSGLDMAHQDLAGKAVQGKDFINNDNDASDDFGHGTAVGGVISASTNNNIGTAGGCWNCKIMPLKALDSTGAGTVSSFANAITYAVDNGAKLINMSVSGPDDSAVEKSAVDYAESKGVLIVAAAGNQQQTAPRYPAAYPSVLSVTAISSTGALWASSNTGPTVDVAAPGVNITTLSYPGGGYAVWTGTSFSTPIITALSALLASAYPMAAPGNIRMAIASTADTCCNNTFPGGKVNATKALAYLANLFPAPTALGDINSDGKVNITDLSVLLSNYNKIGSNTADLNGDAVVNLADLSILLSHWTGP